MDSNEDVRADRWTSPFGYGRSWEACMRILPKHEEDSRELCASGAGYMAATWRPRPINLILVWPGRRQQINHQNGPDERPAAILQACWWATYTPWPGLGYNASCSKASLASIVVLDNGLVLRMWWLLRASRAALTGPSLDRSTKLATCEHPPGCGRLQIACRRLATLPVSTENTA